MYIYVDERTRNESVCACVSQEKESDSESESEVVGADEEDSDFSPEDAAEGQEQQVCGWLGGCVYVDGWAG